MLLFLCALCLWVEFSVTKTKTKTKDKERERKQLLKNSFACIVLCFPFKDIKKMIRCTVTSQVVQPDTLYRVDSTIRGRCVRICAVVNVCMPSKSTNQVVTKQTKKKKVVIKGDCAFDVDQPSPSLAFFFFSIVTVAGVSVLRVNW